jgi:tetratricopeptide (TPR) repeat protein
MLFRFSFWFALAGALLACGCGELQTRHGVSRDGAASSENFPRSNASPDAPLSQQQIEAHARYATAVARALSADNGALDDFYTAAFNDPGDETVVMEVSLEFLRAGQPEKALVLLKRATDRRNASGELFARLGAVYIQLHQTNQAVDASLTAIKKDPRLLGGYHNLLLIYTKAKQEKEARAILDKAANVSGADSDFLIGLGELYIGLGGEFPATKSAAFDRAGELFERAAKANPTPLELRLRLADGFAAVGKYDQAADLYLGLMKDVTDVPFLRDTIRQKLAQIYPLLKDRNRASQLLERFVRESPTDPRAYYLLGEMASEATNFVKAADCFSKSILLNPDFEPAYHGLAEAQLAQDKAFEAKGTLEMGMKRFQSSFVLEYLSGIVDTRLKDFTNAVKHFTSAEIIAQATRPEALKDFFYFQFGAACERIGETAQAEKYFQKCLDLSPNMDEAQNYLGYMWADRGTNLDRAHDLIEKAVKTDPKNPAYLDSMAWVLFKMNRPKDALDFELKAVANSPDQDAEIYNHLGDIYSALGEHEKARDAWRKSVHIESNETVQKKIERVSQ